MKIKTRIFDLANSKYDNLAQLAETMGISVSQVYRVKTGKRNINQKFITGAVKAFPQYRLDQLFYLSLETPATNIDEGNPVTRHHHMVEQLTNHH